MLEFTNQTGGDLDNELLIACESAFNQVFRMEHPDIEISRVSAAITFVTNDEIQKLNKKFRKIDKETDVLSFCSGEAVSGLGEEIYLGDIVISFEKAVLQAESFNHSLKRELAFLTAHSVLHLLGYDHMTESEERVMNRKQEEALDSIGLSRSAI